MVMYFDPVDFDSGIKLGTDRARSKLNDPGLSLSPTSRNQIRRVLNGWPHDVNGRFVELFVEMATLASVVREVYSEPPLIDDEVQSFLAYSSSFFNSFKHR